MTKEIGAWQLVRMEEIKDKEKTEYGKEERMRSLWEKEIKTGNIFRQTNKEIGEKYGVSRETIRQNKNEILEDLDVDDLVDSDLLFGDFLEERKNADNKLEEWDKLSKILNRLGLVAEKSIQAEVDGEEIEDGSIEVEWSSVSGNEKEKD